MVPVGPPTPGVGVDGVQGVPGVPREEVKKKTQIISHFRIVFTCHNVKDFFFIIVFIAKFLLNKIKYLNVYDNTILLSQLMTIFVMMIVANTKLTTVNLHRSKFCNDLFFPSTVYIVIKFSKRK